MSQSGRLTGLGRAGVRAAARPLNLGAVWTDLGIGSRAGAQFDSVAGTTQPSGAVGTALGAGIAFELGVEDAALGAGIAFELGVEDAALGAKDDGGKTACLSHSGAWRGHTSARERATSA